MKTKVQKCIKTIKQLDLDSLFISDAVNISYLSGFRQAEGYLLLTVEGRMIYFTNFLYRQEAKKIKAWEVVCSSIDKDIFTLVQEKLGALNLKRVGFEAKHLPYLEYKVIDDKLSEEQIDFIRTQDVVAKIRAVKASREIALIRESANISRQAFSFVKEIYDQISTEKELSLAIEQFLKLKGDSEAAFPPIVSSGKRTSLPHWRPADVALDKELFLIDLGSKYCGWCADLTRVFFWGKMPTLFTKVYDIVRQAHDFSISKIRDGAAASAVDRAARDYIEKKGWGKFFGHGVGHGVGLNVHELPSLNAANSDVLKKGMVITIEPAIYLPGKFGVRVESMVLVRQKSGEILSGDIDI